LEDLNRRVGRLTIGFREFHGIARAISRALVEFLIAKRFETVVVVVIRRSCGRSP
jgi:hypothetical protein